MKEKNINIEINKTLKCIDNWEKIETDDFFTTRVLNKLGESETKVFKLNPTLKAAVIIAVILINSLSIKYMLTPDYLREEANTNLTTLLSEEYSMNGYSTDDEFIFE